MISENLEKWLDGQEAQVRHLLTYESGASVLERGQAAYDLRLFKLIRQLLAEREAAYWLMDHDPTAEECEAHDNARVITKSLIEEIEK